MAADDEEKAEVAAENVLPELGAGDGRIAPILVCCKRWETVQVY